MKTSKSSPSPGDIWFDMMYELGGDSYTFVVLGVEPSIMGPNFDSFPRFWSVLRTNRAGKITKMRYSSNDLKQWYEDETGLIAMYRVV